MAALPAGAAEPVELRLGVFRAVAREKLEVLDRQEQLVVAGVVDLEAIVRRARDLDRPQADEAADAVVHMDHEIARREARDLLQEVLRAARLLAGADEPVAEDVLLADEGEVAGREPLLEPENRQRDRAGRQAEGLGERADGLELLQPVLGQHGAQPVARALAPGRDHDALALAEQVADLGRGRFEDVRAFQRPLGRERTARPAAAIDDRRLRVRLGLARDDARDRRMLELEAPLVLGEIEGVGR